MRALILSHLYIDPSTRGKLRALAGGGIDLMLALPSGTLGLDGGIRITPVPVKGDPSDPSGSSWSQRALRRILSDFRPDLLHLEVPPGSQAASATAKAARRLHIPYVVFSDESLRPRRGLLERRRYHTTLSGAAGVIGGNLLALSLLAEAAPGAVSTVLPQYGVTLSPPVTRDPAQRTLRLGFIGRLVPERGGEILLHAVAELLGPWTLVIVGTGPEQEALEELAQRMGLASRIRWLGGIPRSELGTVWQDLDCLVVPSHDTPGWVERANPVLLEAMARGIAPVVMRAGALPELVGDAGIVTDDRDALVEALQQLLADPARVRALGERARRRILEEFVDAAVARRTASFWEKVLERVPATPAAK